MEDKIKTLEKLLKKLKTEMYINRKSSGLKQDEIDALENVIKTLKNKQEDILELRCNNCNEIIDAFTSSHYANITTHYVYNKEKRTFEEVGEEVDMDYNVDIEYRCLKCGKVLSEEISDEIVDIL